MNDLALVVVMLFLLVVIVGAACGPELLKGGYHIWRAWRWRHTGKKPSHPMWLPRWLADSDIGS